MANLPSNTSRKKPKLEQTQKMVEEMMKAGVIPSRIYGCGLIMVDSFRFEVSDLGLCLGVRLLRSWPLQRPAFHRSRGSSGFGTGPPPPPDRSRGHRSGQGRRPGGVHEGGQGGGRGAPGRSASSKSGRLVGFCSSCQMWKPVISDGVQDFEDFLYRRV